MSKVQEVSSTIEIIRYEGTRILEEDLVTTHRLCTSQNCKAFEFPMRSIQSTDRSTYEGTRMSEEDAAHLIVLSFASLSQFELYISAG